VCLSVTKSNLQNLIEHGIKDIKTLSQKTGACTSCKSCEYKILELLGQSAWNSGTIKKMTSHNSYINSYLITINNKFPPSKAGQHVIIQVKIDETLGRKTLYDIRLIFR
jgi:NAD(P)H-nitrite reductase large subunit